MRRAWLPPIAAWGLLLALAASAQSLQYYPGDRAVRPVASSGSGIQRVAALGDSITRNVDLDGNVPTGGGPYPRVLGTLLGAGYLVDNHGVGGQTCAQVASRLDSDVLGKGYATAVFLCGTNDLNAGSDSGAAICAVARDGYLRALAAGLHVVAVTVLPEGAADGWTSAIEARRVALNDCIRATPSVPGYAAVRVVDAESTFADPAQPTRLKASFDLGDGIHLSQAGANVLAALVNAAVRP